MFALQNMSGASGFDLGLNWLLLAPVLTVLVGAVIGLLLEAFMPRALRWNVQSVWSILVVVVALVSLAPTVGGRDLTQGVHLVRDELTVDGFAITAQLVILVIGVVALIPLVDRGFAGLSAFAAQPATIPGSYQESVSEEAGYQRSEVLPLALFSLGGMMLFPMANSLLLVFVALELVSLPLYIMTATARHRRLLSQEAAMKYFVLGAFASAFLLMGIALLYGYSGTLKMDQIALVIPAGYSSPLLLSIGVAMVLVGLLFKVGAAPFHAWTPDVYQGAPTPVTGFMAAGVKAAAFLTLLRFYALLGAQVHEQIRPFLWTVALLTMLVGTFFGLVQTNLKRMLAYSSIAHAGFLLIALAPRATAPNGALLFYLLAYGVATVGAFALVYLVRRCDGEGNIGAEAQELADWRGLGRSHPFLATAMLVFLLSFAGIPLTAGFMGKFLVFGAGLEGDATVLVVCAVISSAITAFFYFRLAKIMFLDSPVEAGKVAVAPSHLLYLCVGLCAVLTILLGIFPESLLEIMQNSAIVIP